LQCAAVCCSVLQCGCSVLQCVAVCGRVFKCNAVCCSVLQCVAVCCSVVAVCCSVLQCVAGCSGANLPSGSRSGAKRMHIAKRMHFFSSFDFVSPYFKKISFPQRPNEQISSALFLTDKGSIMCVSLPPPRAPFGAAAYHMCDVIHSHIYHDSCRMHCRFPPPFL